MNCKLFLLLLGALCITGCVRAATVTVHVGDAKNAIKAAFKLLTGADKKTPPSI